jgi:hypothetical protein
MTYLATKDEFEVVFHRSSDIMLAQALGIFLAFFISTTALVVFFSLRHHLEQQKQRAAEVLAASRKAHNVVVGYGTALHKCAAVFKLTALCVWLKMGAGRVR